MTFYVFWSCCTRFPEQWFKRQFKITSCARCDTICPRPLYAGRYRPDAAAQLQPIPYACGAQRALPPIAVGAMNIIELMNINDVRESATIFPRPCKLTFDLESGVRVTCDVGYICAKFGLPRLLCSRLRPDVRDSQTDRLQTSDRRQTKASQNAPAY